MRARRAVGEDAAEHESSTVIALVDYGAGNLTSVKKALDFLGYDYQVPDAPEACAGATGIIVPGVGNIAATAALDGHWRDTIAAAVEAGTPLLGICVGMQWLFEGSDEASDTQCLGELPGRVTRLRGDAGRRLKIPHVGWNALEFQPAAATSRLLAGVTPGDHVYFTHSFAGPVSDACVAAATHVDSFAAAVERGNVFGVQFHPEKSSDAGLQILRNFLGVCRECAPDTAAREGAIRSL
jgi:glutamine amidotransferase